MLLGGAALFRLMGGQGVVLSSATTFARVLFGGAAITFVGAMFDSIMRGEGNVRVPAIWSSVSLALQIALIRRCSCSCWDWGSSARRWRR